MRRPVVLITGSSGGLGRALCTAFSRRGWTVVGHARTLAAVPSGLPAVAADLRHPEAAAEIVTQLQGLGLAPDVLVCNAGLGHFGPPAGLTPDIVDALLEVNVWSAIALTHALLPMLRQRRGAVAFVSSVAAAVPAPDYALYAATKAGLDGFARNLRIELAGQVDVLSLWPGGVRTPMHARSGVPAERSDAWRLAEAAAVANAMADRISARRSSALGIGPTLTRWAGRNLEGLIDRALTRQIANVPDAGIEPRSVLVTGAADGIGLALVRAYVATGASVVGVDVDVQRAAAAETALGPGLRILTADLSERAALTQVSAALLDAGPYDIVIQNAGISAVGAFAESDLAAQRRVFDVNLRAPLQLSVALLAGRGLRPGARLGFLSSLSLYVGYPGAAVYAATKDGLAHFARSLDAALRPTGTTALRIHPGPTRTAHAARYSPDNRREARRMAPDTLAAHIVRALERRERVLIPGLANRAFAELGRWAPGLTERLLKRSLLDKMPGS
mgnify:CR=1 FL=1